jgi:AcrR family transcriptional regulator
MKIIGFPVDVSRSLDGRIVRGLRTRQSLIQATLDLIQAGDVEPTSTAIATIAGVSSRALFQHFASLADLYAAAFDLAVSRAFGSHPPVDAAAPLASRIELLVSDRSELFEQWLPVWHFAERVRSVAPAVGLGVTQLRRLLRVRLAAWFQAELGNLDPSAQDLVLDSLDMAFGLDSWMNMREQLRLSPSHASRTWRFTAEAIVHQALTVPTQPVAAA